MDFKHKVLNYRYCLTELEEELADYIVQNREEVAQMKIVTLASQLYTAPNTITRFCHKLGYDGFTELKVELKNELYVPQKNDFENILLKNLEIINPQKEEKIIRLFQKCSKVNFFALEQGIIIAKACTEHFYTLTDKFRFYFYENELVKRIEEEKESVFFFISLSGEKDVILKMAKLAKEEGHKVVSLTNLTENSLAEIADISLYCYAYKSFYRHFDVTDKTPLMIIMNSLYRHYLETLSGS
ncbi:MurR/RpiR family transcriptional regulator [Lactovum odontotermitis]